MVKSINKSKSILFGVVIGLLILMLVLGCTPATTPTKPPTTAPAGPKIGGILKLSESLQGRSMGYPAKLTGASSNRQAAPVVENLLRYDVSGNVSPWLAETFKEDAVNKTLTLTLKKGVKFHDGTDFNAEAVKWNLDQVKAGKVAGTEKFNSVDVVDDYTIRINLAGWDSTVINGLAETVGMVISPTACKTNGVDWCVNHPVGTGPFQFESYQTDVGEKYKKFDGYWQKGKPYLDGIEFVIITDSVTRKLALTKGEVDVLLMISGKDIQDLEKAGMVVTRRLTGCGADSLIPDSANTTSPFANLKVRQAVYTAIDVAAITKAVWFGEAEPTNQWSFKNSWAYNPSVVGYPYDPAKAKQLLADAGYATGVKTKLIYRSTTQTAVDAVTAMQGFLKAVGIDVSLDGRQDAGYNAITNGGTWEGLYFFGRSGNANVLSQLNQRLGNVQNRNIMMVRPPDYLKALENAFAAPDFATKQKYVWEVQKLMVDTYALNGGFYNWMDSAINQPYVKNTSLYATMDASGWRPEDAWLDKK